jgi:hypothetical protein
MMAKFEGLPAEQKYGLIRKFLDKRIKENLLLRSLGSVQSMSDVEVIGTPEGTIVTIVESFRVMRELGMSDDAIFAAMEAHRASLGRGRMPRNVDLTQYVRYRLRLDHNTGQQLTDDQISMVVTITENFIAKFCNEHPSEDTNQTQTEDSHFTPHPYFMSELPHPEANKPLGTFKSRRGDTSLRYYENPHTIGAIVSGIAPAYRYPQLVVVSDEDSPLAIFRIEQNASGACFLCSLDANGKHDNYGQCSMTDRDSFVKKVGQVMKQIKWSGKHVKSGARKGT